MALKVFRGTTTAAMLLCFLLLYNLNPALAASGGAVGGDSWSDSDSDNSDSHSYRYSSDSDSYRYSSDSDSDSYRYSSDSYRYSSNSDSDPRPEESKGQGIYGLLIMGAFVVLAFKCSSRGRSTVVKLQVGLLGTTNTLQKDLDQIAELAYGSARKDLARVLTGATAALLRHSHYCVSGYSSVANKQTIADSVKCFNQIESEERAKFDEETLVSVNNIKRKTSTERPKGLQNEFIVVTLLVAVKGNHKFLTINDNTDLTKALQNLGSIPSSNLLAVRVLWTPQQENDTLSEQELHEDYPLLKPFCKGRYTI